MEPASEGSSPELARQLFDHGAEVASLFLLHMCCPDWDMEETGRWRRRLPSRATPHARLRRSRRVGLLEENGPIDPMLGDAAEMNRRVLDAFGYRPGPHVGRNPHFATEDWHWDHPTAGWETEAGGGCDLRMIPGDRWSYRVDHLDVAATLRAYLDGRRPAIRRAGPGA